MHPDHVALRPPRAFLHRELALRLRVVVVKGRRKLRRPCAGLRPGLVVMRKTAARDGARNRLAARAAEFARRAQYRRAPPPCLKHRQAAVKARCSGHAKDASDARSEEIDLRQSAARRRAWRAPCVRLDSSDVYGTCSPPCSRPRASPWSAPPSARVRWAHRLGKPGRRRPARRAQPGQPQAQAGLRPALRRARCGICPLRPTSR